MAFTRRSGDGQLLTDPVGFCQAELAASAPPPIRGLDEALVDQDGWVPSPSNPSDLGAAEELLRWRVETVMAIPLHRFLGLSLVDPERPAQGIVLEVGDAAMNNAAVLHGGIFTALLDVACYLSVLPHLASGENAVTHDLTASILKPVTGGSRLSVRGEVVKLGRTTVFTRAEATVDGSVVAFGAVTKSRVTAGPPPSAGL